MTPVIKKICVLTGASLMLGTALVTAILHVQGIRPLSGIQALWETPDAPQIARAYLPPGTLLYAKVRDLKKSAASLSLTAFLRTLGQYPVDRKSTLGGLWQSYQEDLAASSGGWLTLENLLECIGTELVFGIVDAKAPSPEEPQVEFFLQTRLEPRAVFWLGTFEPLFAGAKAPQTVPHEKFTMKLIHPSEEFPGGLSYALRNNILTVVSGVQPELLRRLLDSLERGNRKRESPVPAGDFYGDGDLFQLYLNRERLDGRRILRRFAVLTGSYHTGDDHWMAWLSDSRRVDQHILHAKLTAAHPLTFWQEVHTPGVDHPTVPGGQLPTQDLPATLGTIPDHCVWSRTTKLADPFQDLRSLVDFLETAALSPGGYRAFRESVSAREKLFLKESGNLPALEDWSIFIRTLTTGTAIPLPHWGLVLNSSEARLWQNGCAALVTGVFAEAWNLPVRFKQNTLEGGTLLTLPLLFVPGFNINLWSNDTMLIVTMDDLTLTQVLQCLRGDAPGMLSNPALVALYPEGIPAAHHLTWWDAAATARQLQQVLDSLEQGPFRSLIARYGMEPLHFSQARSALRLAQTLERASWWTTVQSDSRHRQYHLALKDLPA